MTEGPPVPRRRPSHVAETAKSRSLSVSACRALTVVCACAVFATGAPAQTWRTSANASLTQTYTNNVNSDAGSQTTGDWVTSLGAGFRVNGKGARVQLDASVAASWQIYAGETQNNSIAPSVSLFGSVEAVENFFFVDASAQVTTSFLSPFGPQPSSIVNATGNRYVSQTYSVSPYIRGVLGSSNISYQVRNDNIWTVSSSFGNSSNSTPNTYGNRLNASLVSELRPVGWTLEYDRFEYDSGLPTTNSITQVARLIVGYQIDPQLQVSGRVGYEDNRFPDVQAQDTRGSIYGAGFQWSPTERTQVGGFWEEQFFGSAFSWRVSHRLPNAAISANFSRGLTSFPQLALLIPAGVTVTQFLDAAFTTRIPDAAERALAVQEFLARTGLPPTLAAPVNVYGTTISLQNVQNLSVVLVGVRNSLTFTVFNVESSSVGASGEALPPAFLVGQNNTQTGVGVGFSHQLTGFTSLTANATYSTTRANDSAVDDFRSNNFNANVNVSTRLSPKTTATAGVSYTLFQPVSAANASDTSTINAFVSVLHTF